MGQMLLFVNLFASGHNFILHFMAILMRIGGKLTWLGAILCGNPVAPGVPRCRERTLLRLCQNSLPQDRKLRPKAQPRPLYTPNHHN